MTVDKDLAIAYYNALNELAEALPLQEEAVSLRQIAAFPGVIVNEKAEEDLEQDTSKPVGYGMSFRHNNTANVLMCDGHVEPGTFKQYEGSNGNAYLFLGGDF